jgi:hypothetical protein
VSVNKYGGEGGIRTLGTLRYTRFPGEHLRPLGHLSAEEEKYTKERFSVKAFLRCKKYLLLSLSIGGQANRAHVYNLARYSISATRFL